MTLDQRVDSLESEFRLIKAEIQTTLIDLRDFLDRQEFTSAAHRGARQRGARDAQDRSRQPAPEPEPEAGLDAYSSGHAPRTSDTPDPLRFQDEPARHQVGNNVVPNGSLTWPLEHAMTRVPVAGSPQYDPRATASYPPAVSYQVPVAADGILHPSFGAAAPDSTGIPSSAAQASRGVDGHTAAVPSFTGHPRQEPAATVRPAVTADLRLLVGALKWASLAVTLLGPEGPDRVLEMYLSSWPLPAPVERVVRQAIDQVTADSRADGNIGGFQSADQFTLLLLALHGLVMGQVPAVEATDKA
jgi:hypothetical protein